MIFSLQNIGLIVVFLASFVGLLREKPEENSPHSARRRRFKAVLYTLTVVGTLVGLTSGWVSRNDSTAAQQAHDSEHRADQTQIRELQTTISDFRQENDRQYDRHQLELKDLNGRVADLKRDIATQELRKKLASLQQDIDKYIASNPKVKLETGLWDEHSLRPEIYAPTEGDKVKFSISMFNPTSTYARNVEVWLDVCDQCKYAAEPVESSRLQGEPERQRYWRGINLGPHVGWEKQTLEIEVPRPYGRLLVRMRYTCENCEADLEGHDLVIDLGRSSNLQLTPNTPTKPKKPKT